MVTPAEPVLKTKMEDMGSLRAPRKTASGDKQLTSFDILKQAIPREAGPNADVNKVLNQISSLIGLKMAQLVQVGNTVFLIVPKGGKTVEFHLSTIEPISELTKRLVTFSKTLKQMGFEQAVTYVPDKGWLKIAEQTGLPVKISQGAQKIGNDNRPVYQIMVELK
jgi:hypothetical protein